MKNQTLVEKGQNILLGWSITFILNALVILLLKTFTSHFQGFGIPSTPLPIEGIIYSCVIAPILEELIFRKIGFSLFRFYPHYEQNKYYICAVIAALFGFLHGGIMNVYIQGVAGFFFGWVYIKNGNSYWSAVITHSLHNTFLLVIIPILVKSYIG